MVNELKNEFWVHYRGHKIGDICKDATFVSTKMLPFNLIWDASQAIFLKSAFLQVSKEYTNYRYRGDWIFWIDIDLLGDVVISGKLISYFLKHGNDVTSKAITEGYSFLEEIKAMDYFSINEKIAFDQNQFLCPICSVFNFKK